MVALLIDTATERAIVALLDQERPLFLCELPLGLQNSLTLMPSIKQAVEGLGLTLQNLSLVIAGIGPGSYTGIRVGAVVAKTLSFALNKQLVGVSTLYGLVPPEEGHFAAVIDAKIGGVYILFGEKKGSTISYLSEPQMGLPDEFADPLRSVKYLITPQALRLQKIIQTDGAWVERAPDALQMGKLAFDKQMKEQVSLDGSLDVLYLRKTQAEIEKEQAHSLS